jgi:hypothetical protein
MSLAGAMPNIANFPGALRRGDLPRIGKWAQCHGDVARLIESN